jgi:hypothetical protein
VFVVVTYMESNAGDQVKDFKLLLIEEALLGSL